MGKFLSVTAILQHNLLTCSRTPLLLTAILLSGILTGFLSAWYYYLKKSKKEYGSLLEKLDRALGGMPSETFYDESMDSAITERLNQLLQVFQMNQNKANLERDTVKALISDISHQVRTPITNIMLYTGLLAEKDLNKETRLLTDKIKKQADKLDFFIKELVKSSYTVQEMISLHPEMISLEEVIHSACQITETAAMKKQITLLAETTDTLCYADKKWSAEALANLLENAIKYSPAGSSITVMPIIYESFLCIRVKDNGIGIPEEELGLVFERFYRSKEARKEPGFGIGLYLVREILSRQGGYAKITSTPQKGTTAEIYFSRYPLPSRPSPAIHGQFS